METVENKAAQAVDHHGLVLCNRWRRLANSWLAATANIPRGDHVRDNAETRAQAYRDCAEELTALVYAENDQGEGREGTRPDPTKTA